MFKIRNSFLFSSPNPPWQLPGRQECAVNVLTGMECPTSKVKLSFLAPEPIFCYQFQKHLLSTEMLECIKNSLFNKGVHVTCNQGNRITAVMTQNLTGSVFFYQKNLTIFLHCYKFTNPRV